MNNYTLFDGFEYNGNWWLPGRQSDAVGGTASYKDGMLILEIFTPFPADGNGRSPDEGLHPEVILGQSRGTRITLLKARGLPVTPGNTTFFKPKYLITDIHFDPGEVVLTSLSARFTHLEEWLDEDPFEVDLRGGPSGRGRIDYVPPKHTEFDLPQQTDS